MNKKVLILTFLTLSFTATSQPPAPEPKKTPAVAATPRPPDPNFVRWRVYLDTLEQEARSIADERRPYVVTDVGIAYLEYDRDEARRLLLAAMDEAYRFRQQDRQKHEPMLTYVIKTTVRSDRAIAVEMSGRLKKLMSDDKEKGVDVAPYDADRPLLESGGNEGAAARAAAMKSMAPKGLHEGTAVMSLVNDLARTDRALADDLYTTFLRKGTADASIPIGELMQLASYPFGYSDVYWFSNDGSSSSNTWDGRVEKADQRLAAMFLASIYDRIRLGLAALAQMPANSSGEAISTLYALQILAPEIEKFAPALAQPWQELEQRAIIGRTPQQIKSAGDRVAAIRRNRARQAAPAGDAPVTDDETDAMLADIDKITGSCQRDLVYTRAIMNLLGRDLKRSEELASKITDSARAAYMRDIVINQRAQAHLTKGDLEDAEALFVKLSSPMITASSFGSLARAAAGKSSAADAVRYAADAAKAIEKMAEAKEKAAMYFGLATAIIEVAPTESMEFLEKAIKNLNKLEPQNEWGYINTIEVITSCPEDKGRSMWSRGGGLPTSNVLTAVRGFIKHDLESLSSATDMISDKATRVRAQAIVATAGLQKFKSRGN